MQDSFCFRTVKRVRGISKEPEESEEPKEPGELEVGRIKEREGPEKSKSPEEREVEESDRRNKIAEKHNNCRRL